MKKKIEKIGIALAAYEPRIEFFLEQLESIYVQTWPNWVCHISADSTLAHLRNNPRFLKYFSDARFQWSENPKRLGHLKNFEFAIKKCVLMGVDAIACSDQDDVWYPKKIETLAAALSIAPEGSLVHSDLHFFYSNSPIKATSRQTVWQLERRKVNHLQAEELFFCNVVTGCSMMMDSSVAMKFPEIPSGAMYHDHWYALTASCMGGVYPIHEPLLSYRQHLQNQVGLNAAQSMVGIIRSRSYSQLKKIFSEFWTDRIQLAQVIYDQPDEVFDRLRLFLRPIVQGQPFPIDLLYFAIKKLFAAPMVFRAFCKLFIGRYLARNN